MRPMGPEEEQVVASAPEALRAMLLALRERILALHPEATIVAWPKQRIVSFGTGPRKMSEHYLFLAVHPQHVNLGLYRGAELPAPAGVLVEGSGKGLRHVKIRSLEALEQPAMAALAALMRHAYEERAAATAASAPRGPKR